MSATAHRIEIATYLEDEHVGAAVPFVRRKDMIAKMTSEGYVDGGLHCDELEKLRFGVEEDKE